MFRSALAAIILSTCAASIPAIAQDEEKAAPKLIIAISVDQFSADLFAEYRGEFTGGLKRLQQGAVFPAGYQSHAATETCPGHSTILTGNHPARTGIIANDWVDLSVGRDDKMIYCAEDENVPASNSRNYTVSDIHLKVPTLGERMKSANPDTRVVAVAGKDRAAVMMGGHRVDEIWWWGGTGFTSYAGRTEPQSVARANNAVGAAITGAAPAMAIPDFCISHSRAIPIGDGKNVGDGRFARAAGDARAFRATPSFDAAVIDLAGGLIDEMRLGRGNTTDIIAIGASATDYIGHAFGTSGSEMCIQMMALDQKLGEFFNRLDRAEIDYAVMLTADHGGHDLPERNREHAMAEAMRLGTDMSPGTIAKPIAADLNLDGPVLFSGGLGDVWIDTKLSPAQHEEVKTRAMAAYKAHPLVAAVLSREEILATAAPTTPPEAWTIAERVRASYDPMRGGDFYVALKPRVTPIPDPTHGYVATHGSVWDYDRRVPILFWRQGMTRFEQPLSVETVDIAPTLASVIGLSVAEGEFDGRCLDLDAGPQSSCN